MAMSTTVLTSLVPTGSSVKRDAGHLDTLNVMDFEDSNTNRQVMRPNTAGSRPDSVAERSLTPRTRRAVHRGRHETDEQVMALDRHAETLSLQIISSFDVLQQQLEVLRQEQQQRSQSLSRTIAQRTTLRMTVTLELEKAQFENKTVAKQVMYMYRFAQESRTHHEQFQQRMRNEAKNMCAYMSEERTRVFRETQQKYEGLLIAKSDSKKLQFREKLRETMEIEVKNKSDQIAELQKRLRHNNHDEVVQREQLELERAKLV
eukprot:2914239-Amphidinium_carterae.1